MKTLKEKFDKTFKMLGYKDLWGEDNNHMEYTPDDVWDFFSKEIDKVRNETIDKAIEIAKQDELTSQSERIIEKLKELKAIDSAKSDSLKVKGGK